ncbi:Fe-S protein assembly co-chaperone HscB [Canicola haemoglobinophilus]|uniref:Co-chaperone protein HscB homolog n=1 Tax=Canicola haemoglobinophilus TaxID=733 RepID=A0A1V4B0E3_9PAST|nr:Fe-S protein assembly co-chaperone HscB [Canicola haemoglobinophilus]OOR99678.1 Fe-S protein assembly co-chaperone HscB [Canicola haemoglobinophilus]STO59016.1 co-chaperone HscB [Canicola haemoglobinophilus]
MTNPFALFDLDIDFNLDQQLLSQRYLALQKSLHPDNFAHSSAQEQRLAMQKSAEINDALQILKDPISRADSIINLYLGEQNLEQKINQDMIFLIQQMEWREQLEQIEHQRDIDQLFIFVQEIEKVRSEILAQLQQLLTEQNWQQAQLLNDRLRFIKKLFVEIERVEDQLADF